MNYFDYLRIIRKEDTKNNFIVYLMNILDYKEEDAKKEAEFYY